VTAERATQPRAATLTDVQPGTRTAVGIMVGFAADRLLADPRRFHPVAGFGQLAAATESLTFRDHRPAGAVHAVALIAGAAGAGALIGRAGILGTAAATWTVLGGTSLVRTGTRMADHLDAGDLESARALLPSLCGRDPDSLDADGLARAALESIAENTSDATVAPLFWGGVAGVPGLLGYRVINTLDAMIGYRNERYLRFGWAAARIDDLANLAPARVAGLLTAAAAPTVGGRPGDAIRAWRRDAKAHPSPNAGVAEASMAGALGIRLGGRTEYPHGVENRPVLGSGPAPTTADLRRAVRISASVQAGAALGTAALAVAIGKFRRDGGFGRHRGFASGRG
jgi:adenosylcobinamide-phosphate synthase